MKKLIWVLFATIAFFGCEDSDVFYSISYPIEQVDVAVDFKSEAGEIDTVMVNKIKREAIEEAPVKVGGKYVLEFTVFNGGPLRLYPTKEADPIKGTFIKQPGKNEFTFLWGEVEYKVKEGYYMEKQDENSTKNSSQPPRRLTVFIRDLSQTFQGRYPDANISSVTRKEYTSTPF